MFAYRQRGLITLHVALVCALITCLLPVYALLVVPYTPLILNPDVSFLPYGLAIFLGMTASSGSVRKVGGALHALGPAGAVGLAARQIAYVAGAVFTVAFAIKDQAISRLFLGTYLVLAFLLLAGLHAKLPGGLARVLFPKRSKLPTVFVGSGDSLHDLDSWINSRGHVGIEPVGLLADQAPPGRDEDRGGVPLLGNLSALARILRERAVAQVILLDWHLPHEEIEALVRTCEREGVRFLIHNRYTARFARQMTPMEEGGRHFLVMQEEPLEDPLNRAAKRLLDLAIATPVCLFVLPPLGLLVWTMQRIQAPGPLLFNHRRGWRSGRGFTMFKFRSMYWTGHDTGRQASAGDARVFPFGRFMRRTSLDEFPQFLNVLLGDMSLVGPRPHLPQHDEEFSRIARTYRSRTFVKPGMTGMAQVRGYRGEIDDPAKLHQRVYWDLYYVSRWSLWLDLRVILATAWQMIRPPRGAC